MVKQSAASIGIQAGTSTAGHAIRALDHLVAARHPLTDLACFLVPALFMPFTDILPIYATGILRIVSTHAFLSLHFIFVDKDNYHEKLSQKQLEREKNDYLVGIILHMWAQVVLQLLFPAMFFQSSHVIAACSINTLLSHVLVVEPLYYAVHRWLHKPEQMKSMHGHHHTSINPVPSTSLVQNFQEHFIYIATFGPAILLPYFAFGANHWLVVGAYLVLFDIVNAYGHTNIRCRHWAFENKLSPLTYLIYTPEFHLGHHALFNCNYGLFMPVWDHLLGTYRKYVKHDHQPKLLPVRNQDLVFIGHNGGFGHFWTLPEVCFYNIYDSYKRTWMPIEMELLCVSAISRALRLLVSCYKVSRYLVDGKHIGRIICIFRTPLDYLNPSTHQAINNDIVRVIEEQYLSCGTRYFGLGNLNKMKQLNDGGALIADCIRVHPTLKDANIRVWTGDTLTAASVYQQIIAIPHLQELFFIGASGKIATAVSRLLLERNIRICAYSSYECISHPNIRYTQDITEMAGYQYVLVGKSIQPSLVQKALFRRRELSADSSSPSTQYFLDYTVPFIPLQLSGASFRHIQIAVLKVSNDEFLRGYYDICMGTSQNHIYPCHAGCILNMITGRESDETGDIVVSDMEGIWALALKSGLVNKPISFD